MVLNDVKLVGRSGVFNIGIDGAQISFVSQTPFAEFDDPLQLNFKNAIALPGLINSHDHLDFNLFPQLGYKTYANYVDWGEHIHREHKDEIERVLKVPIALRAQWGMYKNLLCGVTTVLNHGQPLHIHEPLITVFSHCQSLHSVKLERDWKVRLNNPLKINTPVAIHIGEGTDEASSREIDELLNWNILQRDLVGIHGVAMDAKQAKQFKALVWCPQSNYFLLNKTAAIDELKHKTTILFGSDSTLTSNWDIWDHLRLARKTQMLSDDELLQSINSKPAKTWGLNSGEIAESKDADIVIAKMHKGASISVFDTRPQDILLVLHRGNIRLFDEKLYSLLSTTDRGTFSKIEINGTCKYIQGDIPALVNQIHQYYPEYNFPVNICEAQAV
jgi:cytosine/adenosine deaminase-related metal-dependent hydrolase